MLTPLSLLVTYPEPCKEDSVASKLENVLQTFLSFWFVLVFFNFFLITFFLVLGLTCREYDENIGSAEGIIHAALELRKYTKTCLVSVACAWCLNCFPAANNVLKILSCLTNRAVTSKHQTYLSCNNFLFGENRKLNFQNILRCFCGFSFY